MRKWKENTEMEWKWRENKEMERDSLSTFFQFLFISSLSIHFLYKICHILSQNAKYGTFVANVTKNLTYALGGNNSGSNSLRGSSASCAGLAGSTFCLNMNNNQRISIVVFIRAIPWVAVDIMQL